MISRPLRFANWISTIKFILFVVKSYLFGVVVQTILVYIPDAFGAFERNPASKVFWTGWQGVAICTLIGVILFLITTYIPAFLPENDPRFKGLRSFLNLTDTELNIVGLFVVVFVQLNLSPKMSAFLASLSLYLNEITTSLVNIAIAFGLTLNPGTLVLLLLVVFVSIGITKLSLFVTVVETKKLEPISKKQPLSPKDGSGVRDPQQN